MRVMREGDDWERVCESGKWGRRILGKRPVKILLRNKRALSESASSEENFACENNAWM